ncbi:hypothetical protein KEM52_001564 [Ascosphaera acerosa]|nr:hypothetical protein KEM52_001564 [Ascosphaera acerosa]
MGMAASGKVETELKDAHAPRPAENERTASIDVRNQDPQSIWSQVKRLTGAKEVPMTAEDKVEDAERRVREQFNEKQRLESRREREQRAQFRAFAQQAQEESQRSAR